MAHQIINILSESEQRLQGVDSPRLSAEVIMASVLDCSRVSLYLERHKHVSPEDAHAIQSLIARRATGEPLSYIIGEQEFYGLDFRVTPDVLIPRPETEGIIDLVVDEFEQCDSLSFADLGTGSGILAITIAHLFPFFQGVAIDMSEGALGVARSNAMLHNVLQRISFCRADFCQPILADSSLDLILANPPYVPLAEYEEASHEVIDFEPISALVSGEDGLDHIRQMLPCIWPSLKVGGKLYMEIGYQQASCIQQIVSLLFQSPFQFNIVQDLSGHDRIIVLEKL